MEKSDCDEKAQEDLFGAQCKIWSWAFSHLISMSIQCAIQLRIPDLFHQHGTTSLSQLVSALHIPPSKTQAFGSMMRVLSTPSTAFFQRQQHHSEEEEEMYSLTPASRLLLRSNPLHQTGLALFHFHPTIKDYCSVLSTWLLQDQDQDQDAATVYEVAKGMSFWDYMAGPSASGQELKGLFNDYMISDSRLVAEAILVSGTGSCNEVLSSSTSLFGGVRSLVDVGGGTGTVAAAVAEAFPDMKCMVLDLPHVVAGLQEGPHPPNLQFIGGDMFHDVPSADAILLKWILHDWDDKSCVKILKCCKEAVSQDAGKKGKVIIIDMVMGDQPTVGNNNNIDLSHEIQLCFDLFMRTLLNGKERNESDWKILFEVAGFNHYKIIGKLGPRSIIEAYP